MEIAILGDSKFVLGFQLAGIRKVFEPKEKIMESIEQIKQDKEIGIVIMDEETMAMFREHERVMIDKSVKPVFIVMSEKASQDNLRKMIIKAIGIDLMR
jgi:V/A-type H+-transporting ATPase subunit F